MPLQHFPETGIFETLEFILRSNVLNMIFVIRFLETLQHFPEMGFFETLEFILRSNVLNMIIVIRFLEIQKTQMQTWKKPFFCEL